MTEADRPAFFDLFRSLAFTFNRKVQTAQVDAYFDALEIAPLAELEKAANTVRRSSKFFPKPVEWLDAVQRNRPALHPEPKEVVLEDGTVETTHYCPVCEDTGWAPDCGCFIAVLDANHECPLHPYVRHEIGYPRPLMRCPCRATNPYFQANHQPIYARDAK